MQSNNRVKKKIFLLLATFLLVAVLAACGEADVSEGNEESSSAGAQSVDPLPEMTEEEQAALRFVEKVVLKGSSDDETEYEVYVPKDADIYEDYAILWGHGLQYYAIGMDLGFNEVLFDYLNDSVEFDSDIWQKDGYNYTDMEFGEMIRCGDDRFRIATAMSVDYNGTPYKIKKIYFMDVMREGAGVMWELQVSESGADDMTNALIDEIAKCYRIDLGEIKVDSSWFVNRAKREEQRQDEYRSPVGENVIERVEGYQYMGLATLTNLRGEAECPIMLPMGAQTSVYEEVAWAYMHGVSISASLVWSNDFSDSVKSDINSTVKSYEGNTDYFANVQAGSTEPIPGYDMARCAVITYESKDIFTDEFWPKVDVLCYIRVQEKYVLEIVINLSFKKYDGSTITVLKELETAYGIDLSEYYSEEL